jgi:hypothetical protein
MMAAVSAIWGRKFENFGRLNSTYITMIPKKDGAEMVKDFRPISLVHSFAKLITKILANRLARRLNEIVSPNKSAFIKGRFFLEHAGDLRIIPLIDRRRYITTQHTHDTTRHNPATTHNHSEQDTRLSLCQA